MSIHFEIERLINYALQQELISQYDVIYIRNQYYYLLEVEHKEEQEDESLMLLSRIKSGMADSSSEMTNTSSGIALLEERLEYPDSFLDNIYEYLMNKPELMAKLGLNRDMVLCKIMSLVIAAPSQVISKFQNLYAQNGINKAMDYFYRLSVASNYIKLLDIQKNQHWLSTTPYGRLEITINLSKPEKDPKEIALAKLQASSSYPKCLLCVENEGFSGNYSKPSRHTHRLIPLTLNEQKWHFQFSPYVYYNEHSIILSDTHRDMQISRDTYAALLDFVDIVPDYIIGANTDIPIVGGSILSHDHFQAGRHIFPMDMAQVREVFSYTKYPEVKAAILDWPLSVIRLQGSRDDLLNLGEEILEHWIEYSDSSVEIINNTNDNRHNALNPIARKLNENNYQLDLILRNNRKNQKHPDGIFHPHQHLHHIKKENIGLIEAMGLAILPGRLATQLELIAQILLTKDKSLITVIDNNHPLYIHKDWLQELYNSTLLLNSHTINDFLRAEVGKKFMQVLECSGVFKNTASGNLAFQRFIEFSGGKFC